MARGSSAAIALIALAALLHASYAAPIRHSSVQYGGEVDDASRGFLHSIRSFLLAKPPSIPTREAGEFSSARVSAMHDSTELNEAIEAKSTPSVEPKIEESSTIPVHSPTYNADEPAMSAEPRIQEEPPVTEGSTDVDNTPAPRVNNFVGESVDVDTRNSGHITEQSVVPEPQTPTSSTPTHEEDNLRTYDVAREYRPQQSAAYSDDSRPEHSETGPERAHSGLDDRRYAQVEPFASAQQAQDYGEEKEALHARASDSPSTADEHGFYDAKRAERRPPATDFSDYSSAGRAESAAPTREDLDGADAEKRALELKIAQATKSFHDVVRSATEEFRESLGQHHLSAVTLDGAARQATQQEIESAHNDVALMQDVIHELQSMHRSMYDMVTQLEHKLQATTDRLARLPATIATAA
mmetsp:Transcript_12279/g.33131  ORF Transcript_12279/g.33131 Transcript_12279/m.33131 type:complete len:412 (+) Transcript_12279:94-1329(+)|eukprot:CAMPEP_0185834016 /NCGR_PEP_ID=MMETSP1353-20130828/3852_1 /TAXON_ID=1077150 /ORGANISM="Erythrolobus australicus, Strain CCMP3124" /LENGTH=411 /DNA_ID=CAMNT_0028532363 /DNA_START=62 /DNA_END=1297 /DNA_ORIENTATION=+